MDKVSELKRLHFMTNITLFFNNPHENHLLSSYIAPCWLIIHSLTHSCVRLSNQMLSFAMKLYSNLKLANPVIKQRFFDWPKQLQVMIHTCMTSKQWIKSDLICLPSKVTLGNLQVVFPAYINPCFGVILHDYQIVGSRICWTISRLSGI